MGSIFILRSHRVFSLGSAIFRALYFAVDFLSSSKNFPSWERKIFFLYWIIYGTWLAAILGLIFGQFEKQKFFRLKTENPWPSSFSCASDRHNWLSYGPNRVKLVNHSWHLVPILKVFNFEHPKRFIPCRNFREPRGLCQPEMLREKQKSLFFEQHLKHVSKHWFMIVHDHVADSDLPVIIQVELEVTFVCQGCV